jgi:nicotinamidase-related amidase
MNKRKKNALLIIDMQNDFVLPTGALPVGGAVQDSERLAAFIDKNIAEIDEIDLTMDSHHVIDIAHPSYWQDKDGNNVPAFTGIMTDFLTEIHEGKWAPKFFPQQSIKYVEQLHSAGEFKHTIWPEHCIVGTEGAAIVKVVADAINNWERTGKLNFKNLIFKGSNPMTEHFGAFRANIPIAGAPETQLNDELIKTLEEYDNVYFAGEAQSHCVANTLKQAMELAPNLAKKFIILTDCMSPVANCEHMADSIFDEAKKMGIRFAKSTDPIL